MSGVEGTVATVAARFLIEALVAIRAQCSADEAAAIDRQLDAIHERKPRALGPRLDEIQEEALRRLGVQRRDRVDLMAPAELVIRAAVGAVEASGADVRLTGAVNALHAARSLVADVVDDPKGERVVVEDPVDAQSARLRAWRAERAAELAAKAAIADRPMGCANCGVAVALVGDPVPPPGTLCARCQPPEGPQHP